MLKDVLPRRGEISTIYHTFASLVVIISILFTLYLLFLLFFIAEDSNDYRDLFLAFTFSALATLFLFAIMSFKQLAFFCPYCNAPFTNALHWRCASCFFTNTKTHSFFRAHSILETCEQCKHQPHALACPFCHVPIILTETAKGWSEQLVLQNCARPAAQANIEPVLPYQVEIEPPSPLDFPQKLRFEGMWIVAPPGRGKTTLLSVLFDHDLESVKRGEASIVVLDSKGDLLDNARRLKLFAPGQPLDGKLTLLEPHEHYPLALNPLDIGASTAHTISLLEYVFSSLLETKPSPLQSTLFRSVLIACKAIPDATFYTFRDFLINGWKPYRKYIETLDPDDKNFFLQGEFDGKTYSETRQQLLWRIRDLTTKAPLLRDMFRAPKTQIDIGAEMDDGRVIIIDNSTALLTEEGSEFFSRFFIALILAAAQQRSLKPAKEKKPVFLYIDECQTVIAKDEKVATILDQCRSQNIALILAHQRLAQIKSDNVLDALANCAIRLANSDEDAHALAPRFRLKRDAMLDFPKGTFLAFARDLRGYPRAVQIPNRPLSDALKMSADEQALIRRAMRKRYAFKPEDYAEAPNVRPLRTAEDRQSFDPDNIDTDPQ